MQNYTTKELFEGIIKAARTGDYGKAASDLNIVVANLKAELSKGTIPAANLPKISYSLETLMAMQKMENWVAFADILEYEFVTLWEVT